MKHLISLIVEVDGEYCGKDGISSSCPKYDGHSGMIKYHHNCLAYNHGLVMVFIENEDGIRESRIRRCAECLEFDQGSATIEEQEKLEAARAVQELRRKEADQL